MRTSLEMVSQFVSDEKLQKMQPVKIPVIIIIYQKRGVFDIVLLKGKIS